jgi:hypothetical protein
VNDDLGQSDVVEELVVWEATISGYLVLEDGTRVLVVSGDNLVMRGTVVVAHAPANLTRH